MFNMVDAIILGLTVIGGIPFVFYYLAERDIFSPITFVGLGYILIIAGPVFDYLLFGTRDILFDQPMNYLIFPLLLIVLSVHLLFIGYSLHVGSSIAARIPQFHTNWHNKRAIGVTLLFTLIGLTSYAIFLHTTGGIPTSMAEISRKRRPPTEYLRFGVSFLYVASLLYWTTIFTSDWQLGLKEFLPGVGLFLIGLTFPIYTSSRSQLIWFITMHLILCHYHWRYLSARVVASLAPVFLIVANSMYILRSGGEITVRSVLDLTTILTGVIGARRNGLTAISHIYEMTGEQLPYRYGESLIQWIIFPIPRSVWEDKPANIGQEMGVEIYGYGVGIIGGGTPPSLIGELWLNFWLIGIIVGMVFFGILIRTGYKYFNPLNTKNPLNIILYAGFTVEICHRMFIGYVSIGILGFVMWLIPVMLAGILISLPVSDETLSR